MREPGYDQGLMSSADSSTANSHRTVPLDAGRQPSGHRLARAYVGTSGWSYRHWLGPFYPPDLPNADMLSFYMHRFDTVEIDATFFRMPEFTTLAAWKRTVPPEFVFAAKASRFITHMKKLKDPKATAVPFLDRMRMPGRQIGPVPFHLPPRWRYDEARLEVFLAGLSSRLRYAFEFRDPTWHSPRRYAQLERRGAACAIFDLDRRLSPKLVTADFVYVRLHGPDGAYRDRCGGEALTVWGTG